jgi:hypothetical protein
MLGFDISEAALEIAKKMPISRMYVHFFQCDIRDQNQ